MIKTDNIKYYCMFLLFCFILQNHVISQGQDNSVNEIADDIYKLKSDIMYAEIKSISDPNQSMQKKNMNELIKYIQMLDIPAGKTESGKQTPSELIENIEPVKLKSPDVKSSAKEIDTTLEPSEVINLTLKDRPDKIINSLALADVLFAKKDYLNAVKFYEVALKETIKSREPEKRAWILFQIANSYKTNNPQQAYAYFDQVVAEFPEYQLSPIALLQKDIIQWHQDNKPVLTLEKYVSDPNSL